MAVSKPQVKILCSYGGKVQANPINNELIYCGGDSRLIPVDRNIGFQELLGKLSSACRVGNGGDVCLSLKYRLPGENLDMLVSLSNDEDLENMMFEYDQNFSSVKTVRIRIFLDVEKTPSEAESGSGSESGSSSLNPDYLFGFDKEEDYSIVCDEQALEEWKIPREQNPPKSGSDHQDQDQDPVAAQPQNLDGHVTCVEAATPSMFCYPPVNGWEMAPAYILVMPPVVPSYYVCVL